MARRDQSSAGTAVIEPPVLAGGRVFGDRYRLEHALGRGGMAAVWLATDERLGRKVAIKVLSDTVAGDDEYLQRFRREAQLAAGLQHPNLVRVYDFDAGQRPYLVMEYIDGGTLAERIEAGEQPRVERLSRELLAALRHIHAAGVLHRDVKPQNVLLDANGNARLADFGIAQPRDATTLTRAGRVLGTESYLAPEVLRGQPATEHSDLYALGMVLADAARGGGSAAIWSLIDRMRAADPAQRPGSAAIALADLEQAVHRAPDGEPTRPFDVPPPEPTARLREQTPTRPPPEPGPVAAQPPEERWRRWLAGGALAAVAVLVLVLAISGGDDGDPASGRAQDGAAASASESGPNAGEGGGEQAGSGSAPTAAADETSGGSEGSGSGTVDGAALNDEGKALLDSGQPEEAIPVLEEAVAALEGSGDDLTYNYALFNLADAYLQAGRPDEAIPLLEERLAYPDQRETVAATLAAAREAAGIETGGGVEEPESGPPPSDGDDGGVGGPPYGNANGHGKDD